MYLSAIAALGDTANPERCSVACYLLRELIDALPRELIHRRSEPLTAGTVVTWVEGEWTVLRNSPNRIRGNGEWRYNPWGPIARFLKSLGDQLSIYRSDFPKHRDLRYQTFLVLDPGLVSLSEPDRDALLKTYERFERYFNRVLHHGAYTPADCEAQIAAFEGFLRNLLTPPLFPKLVLMRRLVAEAEGRADA